MIELTVCEKRERKIDDQPVYLVSLLSHAPDGGDYEVSIGCSLEDFESLRLGQKVRLLPVYEVPHGQPESEVWDDTAASGGTREPI